MHGVVSLLDEVHEERVRRLWAELEDRFGIRLVMERVPYPHVSYHVAHDYDADLLEEILPEFAATREPFTLRTAGLGIFTGERPVLTVSVVRSPALTRLQHDLWELVNEAAEDPSSLYHPTRWMPHITLAHDDMTPVKLGEALAVLVERDFAWEIEIDNLAVIWDTGKPHELGYRFALGEENEQ